jgi:uncharacterized protein YkvS
MGSCTLDEDILFIYRLITPIVEFLIGISGIVELSLEITGTVELYYAGNFQTVFPTRQ